MKQSLRNRRKKENNGDKIVDTENSRRIGRKQRRKYIKRRWKRIRRKRGEKERIKTNNRKKEEDEKWKNIKYNTKIKKEEIKKKDK